MSPPGKTCLCGGQVDRLGWCTRCGAEVTEGPFANPPPNANIALFPGRTCGDGRFTLIERLGQGGMGEVWLAIDERLSAEGAPAEVALKFLVGAATHDLSWTGLLRREVLAARRLSHANIVRVHDWHERPGEPVFYSMEYVPGGTLRDRLSKMPDGRFKSAELTAYLEQLVAALSYSHGSAGMVHRDIKPANILLTRGGQVKLADFGLARPNLGADASVTTEGGTPAYASPQQRRGEPPHPSDDIYSLGAVLYHLTTGHYPFTQEELASSESLPPPLHPWRRLPRNRASKSTITPAAADTILRCLSADPAQRPPTVESVLNGWRYGLPPTEEIRPSLFARFLVPTLAALLILSIVAIVMTHRSRSDEDGDRTNTAGPSNTSIVVSPPGTTAAETPPPPDSILFLLSKTALPNDVHYRIFELKSPTPGAGTLEPLGSGVVMATAQAARLPAGFKGRVRVEIGSGTNSSWESWIRFNADVSSNPTNSVAYNLSNRFRLDLYASAPAPIEMRDEWGNLVVKVESGRYDKQSDSQNLDSAYRLRASYLPLKRLTPGRYQLKVSPEGTNRFYLEPWEQWVDLTTNMSVNCALRTWAWPRMSMSWTNSLGITLLTVPGQTKLLAARTEITLEQFERYAAAKGIPDWPVQSIGAQGSANLGRSRRDIGGISAPSQPVVGVSCDDAEAFCVWLTDVEQNAGALLRTQRYQLPTSEQWSSLAPTNEFPWRGSYPPQLKQGNYAGQEVLGPDWPSKWNDHLLGYTDHESPGLVPVGHYESEPSRFADLGGNAAEWCRDVFKPGMNHLEHWHNPHDKLLQPRPDLELRVVRGASWADSSIDLLRTDAHWAEPRTTRNDRIGFRIVLEEESP
ncbi:MAG: SUMF1/EgtB/PvdO family nonheme iron enzyme [Verrucomicrobiales bacterium]|nr:SUMF1/EgtB/PvdO family nonheme iron enzyme [Verrucomicrobiales bacterium]